MRQTGLPGLTPGVKNLIIVNVIVFIACWLGGPISYYIQKNFALYHWSSPDFRVWQLFTYMFLHSTASIAHILFNMFALWMFGNMVENYLGTQRFLIFYFLCGIGGAVLFMIVQTLMGTVSPSAMVGASGAIFGILFAFGYLYPNITLYVNFFIPMKAKYMVAIYAVIELAMGIRNNPMDNVAHFAHLGGMVAAFILFKLWRIRSNKHLR